MNKDSKIFVAGHKGLVGSAVIRRLKEQGYTNLCTRTHAELDLTRQQNVDDFFAEERPEYVFLCAAKVGGILANSTYVAQFSYENLMISANIINASYRNHVKKLLNPGSSCIYPRHARQPLKEEYLLTNTLEPTNEAYAIAKIAAIKLCSSYNKQYGTNFVSVIPTNLYGPYDNFDLETSHVLPALLRKFHEAKRSGAAHMEIWGTGSPIREFLYVDDLAHALVFIMEKYDAAAIGEFVNIGTGSGITIKELGELLAGIVGYTGEIRWDATKPDGMPKKVMDVTRINRLGWKAQTGLPEGIAKTYQWYRETY
ncbi:MAG: GDP-L-fucose synthase [Nitrospirae bacterium]|nr:MAG: GDP-L-fucose synthase [Nitrospirota bacterium]